jgi:hypothetical protein
MFSTINCLKLNMTRLLAVDGDGKEMWCYYWYFSFVCFRASYVQCWFYCSITLVLLLVFIGWTFSGYASLVLYFYGTSIRRRCGWKTWTNQTFWSIKRIKYVDSKFVWNCFKKNLSCCIEAYDVDWMFEIPLLLMGKNALSSKTFLT